MPISYPYTFVDDTDAEANEVNANFDAASDALDDAISDSQDLLAAPYQHLHAGGGVYPTAQAGTVILGPSGVQSPLLFVHGVSGDHQVAPFYLAAADFSLSDYSTKLRIRAQHFTNAAGPGTTLTVGLYSVSSLSSGAATLSSVVSGSTAAFASTAGNTRATSTSGDFSFPSDGFYVVAIGNSGTTGSDSLLSYQLQLHHT